MNYLDELNPAQKEAVIHQTGPLLVVAGAGAGKTRVITYRIKHLIENGVKPEQILAITFTNKAAKEMKERVDKLLTPNLGAQLPSWGRPLIGTFHSLGAMICRAHARQLGRDRYFSILDRDESITLIKQAERELSVDEKRFEPRKILSAISRAKGDGFSLNEYKSEAGNDFYPKLVTQIWERYQALVAKARAFDFDDLLLETVKLLKREPEILKYYQEQFKYLLIDEYQDTNTVQYDLAKLLAGTAKNICVVGDVDQSIYSWRGADFENLLRFEQDFTGAKVVLLEENYRSTQTILTAANQVISKNKKRHEKTLFTKNNAGEQISVTTSLSELAEADFVASECKKLISADTPASNMAVLYRVNFQSRVLEEAMLRQNVPYQVLGTRFFDRKEVKDLMSYLKVALNNEDYASLSRAISSPTRGIGKTTIMKIAAGERGSLPAAMGRKVQDFFNVLNQIKQTIESKNTSEVIKFTLTASGLESSLKKGGAEEQERLENLRELVTLATKYDYLPAPEGIIALLEEVALASEQDSLNEKKDGVKLMTVHAAKGLEFDYVFITGLEQDLFPHAGFGPSGGRAGETDRDEEEERRLFYVAITRARKKVYLCYAQVRTIFGSRQVTIPSEFIFDIADDLLEMSEHHPTDLPNGGKSYLPDIFF
ncbi:MAG: UvrD-helicase domain-containing protein [bacterium]|nr:UvrD-helicase domain-containing protein [bacterium]